MVKANIMLYEGSQKFMSTVTELVLTSRSIDSAMLAQVRELDLIQILRNMFKLLVLRMYGCQLFKTLADVYKAAAVAAAFRALPRTQLRLLWGWCRRFERLLKSQLHSQSAAHQ
jgi:hypothetical protein